MSNRTRNGLSLAGIVVFMMLAIGSSSSRLNVASFDADKHVEDLKDKRQFIVLENGGTVHAKEVDRRARFFAKDKFRVNDVDYKTKEVRAYRDEKGYFLKHNGQFMRRIVRGKLNVYVEYYTRTSTTNSGPRGGMTTSTRTYTRYWVQRGEEGVLESINSNSDIVELVGDCPLAVEMLDMKSSKLRKTIRREPDYLNTVFDVYNNGCKQRY